MAPTSDLQIIAPRRREHRDALVDFWSKIFGFAGDSTHYFNGREFCRDGYLDGSHYDWDASRIGLIDGQLVTHYGVWGYDMRVGRAAARAGGIGTVSTHPDFRERGYLVRTANASIAAMRERGYDLSVLFGIDDFYHRLGYVRAFSYRQHYLRVDDLPKEKPGAAFRRFKLVRREDTDKLYNRAFAGRTGTAIRPTFTKGGDIRGDGYGWRDGRGRLAGYVYVSIDDAQRRLKCYEAVGDVTQVLRVLGVLGRKHASKELEILNQPRDTPLMREVERGRCEVVTRLNPDGGPMARTLNLPGLLEKMTVELRTRLVSSVLAKRSATLLIDDGTQEAGLRITPRRVSVVQPTQSSHAIKTRGHAVQLVLGTDAPERLIAAAQMKTTGDAARWVAALFPAQDPMLLTFDHF
ncbi:MAG: GNAT family N-acetyltransferase [Planctomycetota bacterium]